jgi:hypothetical protein
VIQQKSTLGYGVSGANHGKAAENATPKQQPPLRWSKASGHFSHR